jgi:L-threonylcarbamoyladenylate synthase
MIWSILILLMIKSRGLFLGPNRFKVSGLRASSTCISAVVLNGDEAGVSIAGRALADGRLVAFPTETVYGLGGNALDVKSCKSIFHTKRRPMSDPLIVHVLSFDAAAILLDFDENKKGRDLFRTLTEEFWPGPLTLIHKAASVVPPEVTASTGYVGVRSPVHPLARRILTAAQVPVAAPSANLFGHVSPTTCKHVLADLGSENILVMKDNDTDESSQSSIYCEHGIESTVCQVSQDGKCLKILRSGPITRSMLSGVLKKAGLVEVDIVVDTNVLVAAPTIGLQSVKNDNNKVVSVGTTPPILSDVALAPGMMLKHYAPDLPTTILTLSKREKEKNEAATKLETLRDAIVLDYGGRLASLRDYCALYLDLSVDGNAAEACQRLYTMLRETESEKVKNMEVKRLFLVDLRDLINSDDLVMALWERMYRAASGKFESFKM